MGRLNLLLASAYAAQAAVDFERAAALREPASPEVHNAAALTARLAAAGAHDCVLTERRHLRAGMRNTRQAIAAAGERGGGGTATKGGGGAEGGTAVGRTLMWRNASRVLTEHGWSCNRSKG